MSYSSYHIVIIDDDSAVRRSLETYFCVLDYQVVSFESAEDYICSALPVPDCLLLDLELASMNGLVALKTLEAKKRLGPTFLITGTDRRDLLERAARSKALAVFQKPIQPDFLAKAVADIVVHGAKPSQHF